MVLLLGMKQEADASAIQSFTTGSIFSGFSNDETVGWRFTVASGTDIFVTALGWWDDVPADPLDATHQVGLWALDGTLLGSTTVQTNSTLNGAFRYESITPILLTAGTGYVIGGRDLSSDSDNYTSSVSSLVMDPRVVFVSAAVSANNAGFSFPSIFTLNSGGRFGPNFELGSAAAAVPEPASLTLLCLGAGLGHALSRRRGRKPVA
jgi:hypothetical protein